MANPACRVCGVPNPYERELVDGVCAECRGKLGLVSMPPSRRPPRPCVRCDSTRFVRVVPRQYTEYSGDDAQPCHIAPMYATTKPDVSEPWWQSVAQAAQVSGMPSPMLGRGLLEMYICSGCGFIEWYCHDVESIPIGPEYNTAIVDYGSDTPYR
jgi:hypothetical protein